jgi:hypothetical protein
MHMIAACEVQPDANDQDKWQRNQIGQQDSVRDLTMKRHEQ